MTTRQEATPSHAPLPASLRRIWRKGRACTQPFFLTALCAGIISFAGLSEVSAKGGTPEERAAGAACLKKICAVLDNEAGKPDAVQCDLSRKWSKEEISASIEKKTKLKWTLGSAQCGIKINIPGTDLTKAVGAGEQQLRVAKQPVNCTLQRGENTYPVKFTLAPVLKLKDGKATGASLGLSDIEAPAAIKAVLWTASKLDSVFSAFEKSTVREVNKFLSKGCKELKAQP